MCVYLYTYICCGDENAIIRCMVACPWWWVEPPSLIDDPPLTLSCLPWSDPRGLSLIAEYIAPSSVHLSSELSSLTCHHACMSTMARNNAIIYRSIRVLNYVYQYILIWLLIFLVQNPIKKWINQQILGRAAQLCSLLSSALAREIYQKSSQQPVLFHFIHLRLLLLPSLLAFDPLATPISIISLLFPSLGLHSSGFLLAFPWCSNII